MAAVPLMGALGEEQVAVFGRHAADGRSAECEGVGGTTRKPMWPEEESGLPDGSALVDADAVLVYAGGAAQYQSFRQSGRALKRDQGAEVVG